MNYIEDALRRQAAMFAALLGGEQRREEDEEKRAGSGGETEPESGGDGALRVLSHTEKPEERQGFPGEMAAWNRLLARRGEGRLHQAAGTRELTDADIATAGSMGAENSFMRSGRTETAWLNVERNAIQRKNGAGTGQGVDRAEMISPEEFFSEGGEADAETAGTVLVVDGGVSAGELSRTFQRDARRYDGGYPLY